MFSNKNSDVINIKLKEIYNITKKNINNEETTNDLKNKFKKLGEMLIEFYQPPQNFNPTDYDVLFDHKFNAILQNIEKAEQNKQFIDNVHNYNFSETTMDDVDPEDEEDLKNSYIIYDQIVQNLINDTNLNIYDIKKIKLGLVCFFNGTGLIDYYKYESDKLFKDEYYEKNKNEIQYTDEQKEKINTKLSNNIEIIDNNKISEDNEKNLNKAINKINAYKNYLAEQLVREYSKELQEVLINISNYDNKEVNATMISDDANQFLINKNLVYYPPSLKAGLKKIQECNSFRYDLTMSFKHNTNKDDIIKRFATFSEIISKNRDHFAIKILKGIAIILSIGIAGIPLLRKKKEGEKGTPLKWETKGAKVASKINNTLFSDKNTESPTNKKVSSNVNKPKT